MLLLMHTPNETQRTSRSVAVVRVEDKFQGGRFVAMGLIGLFVRAIVLSVGYKLICEPFAPWL